MARNEEAEDKSPAQRSVEQQLGQALKEDGTVDQDALRRDHPPLAEVLDALILSKTTRDDPEEIAKDVARRCVRQTWRRPLPGDTMTASSAEGR